MAKTNNPGSFVVALSVASAPSLAMAMTYTVMARTIGGVMSNAVVAERNCQLIAAASTTVVCTLMIKNTGSGS